MAKTKTSSNSLDAGLREKLLEQDIDALKLVQAFAAERIEELEQQHKADALARLHEIARESGFTLEQLTGSGEAGSGTKKRKMPPVPPKYRDPNDADRTWTGRGRQPKWVREQIEAGKDLEDLRIS